MLKQLRSALRKVVGLPELITPRESHAAFLLCYRELQIGVLSLDKGQWRFEYTPEFDQQEQVLPLVDFPDPGRVYQSEELWPFFLSRIPSVAQPEVQSTVEREHLDITNPVDMLKRFGQRSIANPFTLTPAT